MSSLNQSNQIEANQIVNPLVNPQKRIVARCVLLLEGVGGGVGIVREIHEVDDGVTRYRGEEQRAPEEDDEQHADEECPHGPNLSTLRTKVVWKKEKKKTAVSPLFFWNRRRG